MKILAFANANSGPTYHRIIMPLMLMDGPDVVIRNVLKAEDFESCDLFMYNRVLPEAGMSAFRDLRKKYGFRVCVDIDDYWELDEHHILYQAYQEEEYTKRQIGHIIEADIVTTTHERLADIIRPFNCNVHVCPNAIPRYGQFDIEAERYHLTRLFWQGSITHALDISILQRPIEGIRGICQKIKMVMAGHMENEPAWDKMVHDYTGGFRHQYKVIPGKDITEYYGVYKEADICLVPLVKSRFNGFKSNLKILEAANLGLPVIASRVDPYLDMPLLYASSGTEWVKHITRLVASKKRCKEAGQELAAFCEEHYNFKKINNERRQIFEHEVSRIY